MKLKKWKAKTYNIVVSYLLVLMMLINANLAAFIINDHTAEIKAGLLRFASLKSLTSAFVDHTTEFFTEDVEEFTENAINYFKEHIWIGPRLSRGRGTIQGPSGKETYYNLNMSGVIQIMRSMGNKDKYWIRKDGVKMLGDYVIVAANLKAHPRGSYVDTSLGKAIVCDTGPFAKKSTTRLDIATNW